MIMPVGIGRIALLGQYGLFHIVNLQHDNAERLVGEWGLHLGDVPVGREADDESLRHGHEEVRLPLVVVVAYNILFVAVFAVRFR